jgi:hypothetical protein
MINYLLSQIQGLMDTAQRTYGVNPVVFLVIYFLCAPVFYYSIFRTLRALARKASSELLIWSTVFLAATVAPFVYVLLFGHGIPWWVYGLIVILVGQGILGLVLRIRSASANKV